MRQRGLRASLGGSAWTLLPERAAYWPARAMLVVADVHIGKAATFRAHGVPVPHGTAQDNLARLSRLIDATGPDVLVLLGDLVHAPEALGKATVAALARWRERHAELALILVEGNHDARAGALPAQWRVERVAEPWRLDGIALRQHPFADPSATVLAGHMHPVVHLRGRADESVRLPCFWMRERMIVLPAFGDFTGGAALAREANDRVIAVADDRLFEIPAVPAV